MLLTPVHCMGQLKKCGTLRYLFIHSWILVLILHYMLWMFGSCSSLCGCCPLVICRHCHVHATDGALFLWGRFTVKLIFLLGQIKLSQSKSCAFGPRHTACTAAAVAGCRLGHNPNSCVWYDVSQNTYFRYRSGGLFQRFSKCQWVIGSYKNRVKGHNWPA